MALLVALAAAFFAADLAAWHTGIHMTKLGNATLFGNISSFAFAAWGLWIVRSWPSPLQASALALAAVGAGLLMLGSAELSLRNVHGDLLALTAGLLYTGYLISVERARGALGALPLLFFASLFGAAMLLPASLALGEQVAPDDWTFVIILALSSQVLGQGLLVYALGHVPPLIVGLALLTQPAISAVVGWLVYRRDPHPARLGRRNRHRRCAGAGPAARQGLAPPSAGRHLGAMDEPSPLELLRRRLALAVGENAVFDGWTRAAVDAAAGPARHRSRAGAAGDAQERRPAWSTPTSRASTASSSSGCRPTSSAALKIRERIRTLVWTPAGDHGSGARGGAARDRDIGDAAERAAGARASAGARPT